MRKLLLVIFLLASAHAALSQESPKPAAPQTQPPATQSQANPLSEHNRFAYGIMKLVLLRSAEKMPEENYGFRPTEAVRTYGQIVGHLADAQYAFCSAALGEKNPALELRIEKNKTTKADLINALKDAFAYCDRAYDSLTDAQATQAVKLMGMDTPKLIALMGNSMHSAEHYGNLVTYMRMKNIVPPTSEPGFMPQPKK
jgi:uncharacterized damage-inducible protein DinB